jgi:hypothetical protein
MIFGALLRALGCEPQAKKVWFEGGFTSNTKMLGVLFHLDANPMYVSIPEDKVQKTIRAISSVLRRHWAPADMCQSLLGLLAFHGRVLLTGRWHLPFTVRALATACVDGVAPVTSLWRDELQWWADLLSSWNRRSILVPRVYTVWDQAPLEVPLTDAARAVGKPSGAGAVFGRFYQHFLFTDDEVRRLDIM